MNSSKSLPKRANKTSFKPVPPFDLFYQLTYMSAMAASGISRSKIFELAAQSSSLTATYFIAINTLVDELRFDFPEACRTVGAQAKSDNVRSFLLRLADALRSGEPLAEYLAREADVQSQAYTNHYERDLEALKQWSNAFSSLVISVALIVIIQVISSMLYSVNRQMMMSLVGAGVLMAGFGAWIIWRSAPSEIMNVKAERGSKEQRLSVRLMRTLIPIGIMVSAILYVIGVSAGPNMILFSFFLVPIGVVSLMVDQQVIKKDDEFSTFLRSTGSMATSSGTTLKESLTKIDLTSFPTLQTDILRLSERLQALIDPEICWQRFGEESGSRLISDVVDIFYGGVRIGGEPERVGYLCSLFTAKTSQLRAKRRLTGQTFAGLTTVMQTVVAGIMVFVLAIVNNFAELVKDLVPANEGSDQAQQTMKMGMADFTASELQFLSMLTVSMVVLLAVIGSFAIIAADGGYKLKVTLFLGLAILISGVCFIVVPPMVDGILTM